MIKKRIGTALMIIGAVCVCAAVCLFAYNQYESWQARLSAESLLDELLSQQNALDFDDPYADLPIAVIDGNEYIGYLSVPSLDLYLPVANDWDYTLLKLSPCRYNGHPAYGDFVICAHNYSSHFGHLKDIDLGATVAFTANDGRTWTYEVVHLATYLPTDVEKMISGDYDLMLFTCTYGGRTRVTVGCNIKSFSM